MKTNYKIKIMLKNFHILCICIFVFFFQINSQILKALPMDTLRSGPVIEELRLKVPSEFKEVWLNAEKKIWDPWLSSKDGFLGRQIFWNKENQEALILVKWKNKKLWKDISIEEVNLIQEKFEKNVMSSLNLNQNPIKLIYEGELHRQ